MKKYVAICSTLAALAWAGIAGATVPLPPAQITGSGDFTSGGWVEFDAPVTDGGAAYFGKENDRSGNCNGDTGGAVNFNGFVNPSFCAHYVAASRDGSGPKMRFAVFMSGTFTTLWLFRISDGGFEQDTVAFAMAPLAATSNETATAWVNTGRLGSGNTATAWQFQTVEAGDYTISTS